MPVIGLTDNIQSRLPRLGKLRKGGEKEKNSKGEEVYGKDLDHFRFTSDRPEILDAFVEAYGETPRNINVYLPYPTPQQAFPVWSEVWNASGLAHRCDGKNMIRWLEGDKYIDGSKPCAGGHTKNDYLLDAVGRLDVIVPELIEAGFVGYITLETHAKNDIVAILATLEAVYQERQENPLGLRGILFNLRRVKENISIPGYGKRSGQRSRADKWLVKLEPAAEWIRLQIEMAHAAQFAGELPAWSSGTPSEVVEAEIVEESSGNGSNGSEKSQPPAHSQSVKIRELGQKLWPGQWDEKRLVLAENFKKDGKTDLETTLKFVEGRAKEIQDVKAFTTHVAKAWPNHEFAQLVPLIVKECKGDKFDRFQVLEGMAQAAEAQQAEPGLQNADLLEIILKYVPEASIPEEFQK